MAFWSFHRDVYHREQGVGPGVHAEEFQLLLVSILVFTLAVLSFASRAF